jgi:hypothetical protein
MEITVGDLQRSRYRHLLWCLVAGVVTGLLMRAIKIMDVARRSHGIAATTMHLRFGLVGSTFTIDRYDLAVWVTLIAMVVTIYQFWQWRRKSRRYRGQRRRAANERLREDFRAAHRF